MSCKKAYNPVVISSPNSYLVVEGVISTGNDSTIIKLSKTVPLSDIDTTGLNKVTDASVTLEGEQSGSQQLMQVSAGRYASSSLTLPGNQKYRVHIQTGGREYVSDFVEAKTTPPIDKITYKVKSDGVPGFQINVSTHDATNNTRYYRWDYVETYEFTSDYESLYKSNGDTVLNRDLVNDQIYRCWHTNASSDIVIANSNKLAQDVIADQQVSLISTPSEKLVKRYSILVREYALTKEAYEFWENLKKNTEQLGGVFDAQPSQLEGNLHCVNNPAEPVIGFISASTVTTKRIYINYSDIPSQVAQKPNFGCSLDRFLFMDVRGPYVIVNDEDIYFNYNKAGAILAIPVDQIKSNTNVLLGHTGSTPRCVDCTLRGTNKKPTFWVE